MRGQRLSAGRPRIGHGQYLAEDERTRLQQRYRWPSQPAMPISSRGGLEQARLLQRAASTHNRSARPESMAGATKMGAIMASTSPLSNLQTENPGGHRCTRMAQGRANREITDTAWSLPRCMFTVQHVDDQIKRDDADVTPGRWDWGRSQYARCAGCRQVDEDEHACQADAPNRQDNRRHGHSLE